MVEAFFVENMNNHISETNLSVTVDENNNNILTLDLLAKAKELIVGLNLMM